MVFGWSYLLFCSRLSLQWTHKIVNQKMRWIVWESTMDGGFDLYWLVKLVLNQSIVPSRWLRCPSFLPLSTSLSRSCQSPFISLSTSILSCRLFFENYLTFLTERKKFVFVSVSLPKKEYMRMNWTLKKKFETFCSSLLMQYSYSQWTLCGFSLSYLFPVTNRDS